MSDDPFQAPEWFLALTLRERVVSFRTGASSAAPGAADAAHAARRLDRWRAQRPFGDAAIFTRRLASDGITEKELSTLLGEPASAVRERCAATPPWLAELASAMPRPGSGEEQRSDDRPSFLQLVRPLLDRAVHRLRDHVEALARSRAKVPFDAETVIGILFGDVPEALTDMMARTLVLELNVARLDGELTGDTPEERFRSFVRRLGEPDVALRVLSEYPVLARQVVNTLDRWIATSAELLRNLCDDWDAIVAELAGGTDPGPLVELSGAGDTHRGGRRVRIAAFASGFRLVHKPKSLAVDHHFQELVRWVNDRGATPPFRMLRLLDRGTYGWVEHLSNDGCTSAVEVERFYQRLGGYLALFHALEATDFHAENLLATGEHPMPIDLEALFHPRPRSAADPDASDLATRALNHSVARVGILPERMWATADSLGVDMSGMGNPEGQLTPFAVPQWKDAATDTMQLVRERAPMLGTRNQPTLGGAAVNILEHAAAVEEGFRRTYQLLLEHRDALLEPGGPLTWFSGDEVRVILRMTQTYASLLRESFHPDVLRDALDRDRLFDKLWRQVGDAPHLEAVIPAERDDLLQGDLPMFTTSPGSRDLWTSRGERIPEFFAEPGLAVVERKVRSLGEADLARQLWIVRASLATVATGVASVDRRTAAASAAPARVDRERLVAAARAIGDRLETLAVRDGRDATWLGLNLIDEQHWTVTPLGVDLYDGVPGVALFLAYLAATTGEERFASLARSAMSTLRWQLLPRMRDHFPRIGGFSGWGGTAYALAHLAVLWNEPALLDEAERLVALVPPLVAQDDQLDVIGGAAGCIGALLAVNRVRASPKAVAAAVACGDHLVAHAAPVPGREGRAVPATGASGPLSGFSHGAAGMAWALLELAAVTGEERFRATALDMIRYERTVFSPEAENWLDLRDFANRDLPAGAHVAATFWCHGAPGIGLGRIAALRHVDDPLLRDEIATATRTTLRTGFGDNHSLCHGDLGNVELLLQTIQLPGGGGDREAVDRVASRVLAEIDREGWRCGNPRAVESPGLMTGLAGIGYGLLRIADSARIPAVLVLAPPETGARPRVNEA
jgi:class II lanthipeptide synthase